MEWRGPELTIVGKVLAPGLELAHRKPELRMQEAGQVFSFLLKEIILYAFKCSFWTLYFRRNSSFVSYLMT